MNGPRLGIVLAVLLASCGGPAWTDPLPPGERRPVAEWVASWRPDVFASACAARAPGAVAFELAQSLESGHVVVDAALSATCSPRARWALRLGRGDSCGEGCELSFIPAVDSSAIEAWSTMEAERRRLGGRSRTGTLLVPTFDGAMLSTQEFGVVATSSAVARGELFRVGTGDRVELAEGLQIEVVGSESSSRGGLALRVDVGGARALVVFDLDRSAQRELIRRVCRGGPPCGSLQAQMLAVALPVDDAAAPLSETLLRAVQPDTVILASGAEPRWETLTDRVESARRIAHAVDAELISLHETRVRARAASGHWALDVDAAASR